MAFQHWALGMLSLQLHTIQWATNTLNAEFTNEKAPDWALAVSQLSEEERGLVVQHFFDQIEMLSKTKPEEKFGTIVREAGFWFAKDFLPNQPSVCAAGLTATK